MTINKMKYLKLYVNEVIEGLDHIFLSLGWMFMSREQLKKPPLYFKIWALWVHSLSSLSTFGRKSTNTGKAMLYSYQGALPSLPVPPVKKTLERYAAICKTKVNFFNLIL